MNDDMKRYHFLLIFFAAALYMHAQGPEVVIPAPYSYELHDGIYSYSDEPFIRFKRVSDKKVCAEGYVMTMTLEGVTVMTSSDAGEFYALQTLRQMTRDGEIKEICCCEITDAPRFPYRGMHFDVSRHFRSVDFLKKQIDAMAMFKMNRMHIRV